MTTVIPFHPIAPSFRPTGGPVPQTQLPYTQPQPQPQPQSQLQGKCIASRFRTKLCDKWLDNRGHCPYGARCMFAHGPQELRTTEMNIRDGLTDEETIRVFKRFVQLRNAGIEVQVPACLQRVDWGAGRRFVVTHAPPHGAVSPSETVSSRDSVRNASPASFRWCPYSTTQCKVYFDEAGSLAGSGRASPAPTAESHSSDELPDFRLSPNLEYEI